MIVYDGLVVHIYMSAVQGKAQVPLAPLLVKPHKYSCYKFESFNNSR